MNGNARATAIPCSRTTIDEGFEIVRRRLFQPMTEQKDFAARDAVIRGFTGMYRKESGQFPAVVHEAEYRRRLEAAYPIHPELFRQLYEGWSTLDKFQRTRGVLRLMASVIHTLWKRQDGSLMIMPATIPMDAGPVIDELTRYLDNPWRPVIERDIDGESSLPLQLDKDNSNYGRVSAARRVARTVYLGSAPTLNTANRGIEEREIRLGAAQPGETVAVFGDALRTLSDRATHLYVDRGKYWFSTQPSVTRTAQERAQALSADDVAVEITSRVRQQVSQRGDFASVHPCPVSSADVRDERETRLVILDPDHPHVRGARGADDSQAIAAATAILGHRGESPRLFRNALVFAAADRTKLADLDEAVRQYLAWKGICEESEQLNLDSFQRTQAESKQLEANKAVDARVPETYLWLLVPSQEVRSSTVEWEEFRAQGEGSIALRASQRMKSESLMYTQWNGTGLRQELDRVPLWRGDHVSLKELADHFAQYLYLPRLKNPDVLLDAMASGLGTMLWATETFALAERYDAAANRYLGLTGGEHRRPSLDTDTVLVRPDIAKRQLDEDRALTGSPQADGAGTSLGEWGETAERAGEAASPIASVERKTRRYWANIEIDPTAMATQPAKIGQEIVRHLAAIPEGQVRVTIDIDATVPEGIPDDLRRVLNENSQTLKFKDHGFEES